MDRIIIQDMTKIILILVCVLSIFFYGYFPERVATHWGFSGEPDGYSGKAMGAFAVPIMMLLMAGLFWLLPKIDPHKEQYKNFAGSYKVIQTAVLGLLAIIYVLTGIYNLGYKIEIGKTVGVLVGIMMIVMGKEMKNLKKNWFVGIKTPWTLSSDKVWKKTHNLGGKMFMVYGGMLVMAPFLAEVWGLLMLFGGAVMLALGTMGYSYWEYRNETSGKDKK
jgi:uncharacterized membrane protein